MNTFKEQEVCWGVLGAGDVCEVKSAPAMQKIPGSRIVAVARRNEEKAESFARRHQVPKWYNNAHDLIHDTEVNAVYIATPPDSHLMFTAMAAQAGKPVYVEKPMARTYEECQKMIRVCSEHGVPLFVAYYRRVLPNYLHIQSMIQSGVIGDVRTVNIQFCRSAVKDKKNDPDNWRVHPEIAGGGYFFDLASHQLDYLDFLFGRITQARGICANQAGLYPAEDMVTAAFEFESGVIGTGNWCFTSAEISQADRTVIIGSKGHIEYQTFGTGSFEVKTDDKGTETFHHDLPEHIQYPLIEKIVGELLGRDTCPSTGETAARTNWVLSQIVSQDAVSL